MCAGITFDDSLWPLLIVCFRGGASDKQYAEMLTRSSSYVERGERYVSILDVSQAGIPTAAQRQMQVEWLRKHDTRLHERVLGNATIVTSAPIRLSLSIIFHIKPLPIPNVAVSDLDSALRFVLGKLEEGGLSSDAERIRHHYGLSGVHAG
ncbi:hypothetical protein [Vitiosangium sp. GDMCC 1.1324]|uniref:hypothetical protein n=1 Tax=Vitiosangium sp. (strain GDMCC 1.1324) TaxID=2138576 RepID=UPI000D34006A|nr:hypothetical protein [Vitiosangium sp. GDMCC 1.1324]PTL78608.1 hypothetical protein DAT35_39505 [Vitiosangium sp. GDMCC 1.1324]